MSDFTGEDVVVLKSDDPVERVFADCVKVYRERSKKYTSTRWDDNFQHIAKRMRENGFPEFSAADAASVLMFVKEARQVAANDSGRRDFDDDSYRDSDIDDINYRAIRRALRDVEEAFDGVMQDLEVDVELGEG